MLGGGGEAGTENHGGRLDSSVTARQPASSFVHSGCTSSRSTLKPLGSWGPPPRDSLLTESTARHVFPEGDGGADWADWGGHADWADCGGGDGGGDGAGAADCADFGGGGAAWKMDDGTRQSGGAFALDGPTAHGGPTGADFTRTRGGTGADCSRIGGADLTGMLPAMGGQ